jgi:hypothetical protein
MSEPLEPEVEEWLDRLVAEAPQFSEHQEDVIAGAFSGVLEAQAGDDAPT